MDRTTCTFRLRRRIRSNRQSYSSGPSRWGLLMLALVASLTSAFPARAQDTINGNISNGVNTIRIAVANFKPLAGDPESAAYKQTFDATLYADLASAGIFDIVSKSLMPPTMPGAPSA